MRLENIEDGMVIEVRKGTRYVKIRNRLIGMEGWLYLSSYKDDLTSGSGSDEFDIMKIYTMESFAFKPILEGSKHSRNLIWERKELIRIDSYEKLEEARKRISKMVGAELFIADKKIIDCIIIEEIGLRTEEIRYEDYGYCLCEKFKECIV